MEGKKHKIKSFVLAFFAALLVLAATAALTLMSFGKANGIISSQPEIKEDSDSYIPEDEDSLTVLLSFHEDPTTEGGPASYTLLRFDSATARILSIPLPYQLNPDGKEGSPTLEAIWREGGSEAVSASITEHLGFAVDAWVDMDVKSLEKFIGRIGTVKYDIEENASFTRAERDVALSRGRQLLDARKIVDVAYYYQTSKGEMARNDFIAQVVALFADVRIAPLYLENQEKLYENILACFSTNLSASQYVSREGFFKSLFRKTDRTVAVSLGGKYYGERTGFLLSETAASTLRGLLK